MIPKATAAWLAVTSAIAGAALALLAAHLIARPAAAQSSLPDPQTVTCHRWANLSVDVKDAILAALHSTVSRDEVDTECRGLPWGPNDPVSAAVNNP
jgi:hypothetical protein